LKANISHGERPSQIKYRKEVRRDGGQKVTTVRTWTNDKKKSSSLIKKKKRKEVKWDLTVGQINQGQSDSQ